MLTVRPVIAQFFSVLCDFATQEPEFLGSKFRSILLNLKPSTAGKPVVSNSWRPRGRPTVHGAHRPHGLQSPGPHGRTASPINGQGVRQGLLRGIRAGPLIADYSELRTKDHPLQYRTLIVSLTHQMRHEEQRRSSLLAWYTEKRAGGDSARAETLFERDSLQLLRLSEVHEQLRRVDEEIRIANQQGLVLMAYSMRAPRNFDNSSRARFRPWSTCAKATLGFQPPAARATPPSGAWPSPACSSIPGRHGCPSQDPYPGGAGVGIAPSQDGRGPNGEAHAAHPLYRPAPEGPQRISCQELTIESINDLCCYQRLLLIASRSECPPEMRRDDPLLKLPGVRVGFAPDSSTRNAYMEHRTFRIQRERA